MMVNSIVHLVTINLFNTLFHRIDMTKVNETIPSTVSSICHSTIFLAVVPLPARGFSSYFFLATVNT